MKKVLLLLSAVLGVFSSGFSQTYGVGTISAANVATFPAFTANSTVYASSAGIGYAAQISVQGSGLSIALHVYWSDGTIVKQVPDASIYNNITQSSGAITASATGVYTVSVPAGTVYVEGIGAGSGSAQVKVNVGPVGGTIVSSGGGPASNININSVTSGLYLPGQEYLQFNSPLPSYTNGQTQAGLQMDASGVQYVDPLASSVFSDSQAIAPYLGTAGGLPSAATENSGVTSTLVLLRGTAVNFHGGEVYNPNNVAVYLETWNAATTGAVTLGTTAPTKTFLIPPGVVLHINASNVQRSYSSGLVYCAITTYNAASGAPASNLWVSFDVN